MPEGLRPCVDFPRGARARSLPGACPGKVSEQRADCKREFEWGSSLIVHDVRAATRTPQERVFQDILLECAWSYIYACVVDVRDI